MTIPNLMPEGVVLEGSLDERGRCCLEFEVAAAPQLGRSTSPDEIHWYRLRAVISTTFDLLTISPAAATRMRLIASGEVLTDSAQRPEYPASKAPVAVRFSDGSGSELTSPFWATILTIPADVDAIIGVDQLRLGRLTIDGWNGSWRWALAGERGVRTHRQRTDDRGRH